MQQGGIHPPHQLEIHGHLPEARHLFVMAIVALPADFRAEKDLFDLLDPWFLALGLAVLAGPFLNDDRADDDQEKRQQPRYAPTGIHHAWHPRQQ